MINLAKNPADDASLSVGEQLEGEKVYVISLNDNAADGRDTSWIYDADFEKLSKQRIEAIIVTGTRRRTSIAIEESQRLKYQL